MDREHDEKLKMEEERKKRMDMEFSECKAFLELIQKLSEQQIFERVNHALMANVSLIIIQMYHLP